MGDFDDLYKDVDFDWLDDVIDRASFPYYAFVVSNKYIDQDGSEKVTYTRYKIKGSLQTYKKNTKWDQDGSSSNVSGRTGKFYAKYAVRLNENDLIQRMDNGITYRVIQTSDFDYVGVRNYEVERLGIDELMRYDFSNYVEQEFPEGTVVD